MPAEVFSRLFLNFADQECRGSSPLYEYLSVHISKDDELLGICSMARKGQPIPNLLFGAVHYLLLKGKEHPLKAFYPSIVPISRSYRDSYEPFRDFCLTYRNEIESILKTRLVQTNEVRRCAYLYPVFCRVYEMAKKPLALIEIGTSAGLQLLWDQYSYNYGRRAIFGKADSTITISSELKGEMSMSLLSAPPPVSKRIGIDLHTIDVNDEEEKMWLTSLIWPEHTERLSLFGKAASLMKEFPVDLVKGDGIRLLPHYAETIPESSVICIFHTHVANQMTDASKVELLQSVKSIGKERDVFHIYNNIQDRYLHLHCHLNGEEAMYTVAETEGHGRWFRWLLGH